MALLVLPTAKISPLFSSAFTGTLLTIKEIFCFCAHSNIFLAIWRWNDSSKVRCDKNAATLSWSFTKILVGKLGFPSFIKLIGGKTSESITPANLNCDVCIIDSVAITLLNPKEGKPSIRYPPSSSNFLNSLICKSGSINSIFLASHNSFFLIFSNYSLGMIRIYFTKSSKWHFEEQNPRRPSSSILPQVLHFSSILIANTW